MASMRGRLAERLVAAIGIKRRLQRIAQVDDDPVALQRALRTLRRTDRTSPPRRVRRAWGHEQFEVDGFALHLLTARPVLSGRVILYLHGGGYMFGPFGTEWKAVATIAAGSDCDFAVLVYPKAPEHQAPRTIAVALQAGEALGRRYGAESLILMGTSAGGALAVAMMTAWREQGRPLPARAVLLSPGVDMTLHHDVGHLENGDVLLSVDHVRSAGALYAGSLGAGHPTVSPLFADLAGLPTMHVFAGTREILFPSLEAFVERARTAGTDAHLVEGEDQQHTWPLSPTPEGSAARHRIIEIIGPGGGR